LPTGGLCGLCGIRNRFCTAFWNSGSLVGSGVFDMDDLADEHAAILGHVAVAWNDVHWMLYRVFHTLSGMSEAQAKAVFFALKADSNQREIVQALAKSTLLRWPTELAQFISLMKRTNVVAGDRNAATHTMWATHYPSGRVMPNPWTPRHGSLTDDYEQQFLTLTKELREIFRDLITFHNDLEKLAPFRDKDQ
jgi:hypothetical protein